MGMSCGRLGGTQTQGWDARKAPGSHKVAPQYPVWPRPALGLLGKVAATPGAPIPSPAVPGVWKAVGDRSPDLGSQGEERA